MSGNIRMIGYGLASEFGRVEVRVSVAAGDHRGNSVDRRLALAKEWDDLLEEIRSDPEFADFLRPLPAEQLMAAADGGPVILINVSRWRCDALVVTTMAVEAVPLPDLFSDEAADRMHAHLGALAAYDDAVAELESVRSRVRSGGVDGDQARAYQLAARARQRASRHVELLLRELTAWLWDVVIVPLLPYLPEPRGDELARVWWCPTGPLTLLPIHAAGKGEDWLVDRVVSSYTPTVRALLEARRPRSASTEPRFLVANAFEPAGDFPGVISLEEVDVQVLNGDDATVDAVRSELPRCRWVHFNCHGDQDLRDPSRGGVVLSDGMLRIFDVAALPLDGDFAGLSACKTAVGGTELLDESVTLAAALHYTGFRHVVGTLWNLAADIAAEVFADIYAELATDGTFVAHEAANALSRQVRCLRVEANLHDWACLIHIGP